MRLIAIEFVYKSYVCLPDITFTGIKIWISSRNDQICKWGLAYMHYLGKHFRWLKNLNFFGVSRGDEAVDLEMHF